MTTLADSLRDRLDQPRIREQAEIVNHAAFTLGAPVYLSYTPGNSTCYPLVFTPTGPSPELERHTNGTFPVPHTGRWLFVAWLEHGAYPFDFDAVPVDAGYIAEKLDRRAGLSDAIALHELFTAIQEAT